MKAIHGAEQDVEMNVVKGVLCLLLQGFFIICVIHDNDVHQMKFSNLFFWD